MSGTLDSKLLRPDPLLLLPMLEEGDGDFPYSWNLGSKKKIRKEQILIGIHQNNMIII